MARVKSPVRWGAARSLAALGAMAGALALGACGSSGNASGSATTGARFSPLKFADCMRAHGLPNCPDPSPGGGIEIAPGSGIDPQSPAFQTAQKACGALAPGGNGPPQMSESQRQHALAFAATACGLRLPPPGGKAQRAPAP